MAKLTIYADGDRNLEVIKITNNMTAALERKICECAPGNAAEAQEFDLRRGDFLIVRIED